MKKADCNGWLGQSSVIQKSAIQLNLILSCFLDNQKHKFKANVNNE